MTKIIKKTHPGTIIGIIVVAVVVIIALVMFFLRV
jgi:hypothetical protein